MAFINFIQLLIISGDAFNRIYNANVAATAGPHNITIINQSGQEVVNHAVQDVSERLHKRNDLKEKGIISNEEFEEQKKKILAS